MCGYRVRDREYDIMGADHGSPGECIFLYGMVARLIFRGDLQHMLARGAVAVEFIDISEALIVRKAKPFPVQRRPDIPDGPEIVLHRKCHFRGAAKHCPMGKANEDHGSFFVLHQLKISKFLEACGGPATRSEE